MCVNLCLCQNWMWLNSEAIEHHIFKSTTCWRAVSRGGGRGFDGCWLDGGGVFLCVCVCVWGSKSTLTTKKEKEKKSNCFKKKLL